MAQILDLGKIRFQFKGEWSSATEYQVMDVVSYNGNSYTYISTTRTTNTPTNNTTYWAPLSNGFQFEGTWDNGTTYGTGSVVRYGGDLFLYTYANGATAGHLPTDTLYWTLFMTGWSFIGVWSGSTTYKIGEVVTYGGIAYVALQDGTNQNPNTATSYWSTIVPGFQFEGVYNGSTGYQKNDLVSYGGNTYIALQPTTGNLPTNGTYWSLFASGFNFRSAWDIGTAYKISDVVAYGGVVYIAVADSTGQNPENNLTYWTTFVPGFQFEGAYNGSTTYQKNDIVTYGAIAYVALQTTTGNLPTNGTYWTVLAAGVSVTGAYNGSTAYKKNDIVTYGAITYIATQDTTGNLPTNGTYWTVLAAGFGFQSTYSGSTAYFKNDVVTYGGSAYIATQATTGNLPTNTSYWTLLVAGISFQGGYSSGTNYLIGQSVTSGGTTYLAIVDVPAGTLVSNTSYWTPLAVGTASAIPLQTAGTVNLSSSDATLTTAADASTFANLVRITAAREFANLTLPNATSASLGTTKYRISNETQWAVGLRDNSGALLAAIQAYGFADVALAANGTQAGVWTVEGKDISPVFVRNSVVVPNANATATNNSATTNPFFECRLDSNRVFTAVTVATATTINLFCTDYSTVPATVSSVPLVQAVGNATILGTYAVSSTRAIVFTLTQAYLFDITGTTVTLVTNTTTYTSPVRTGVMGVLAAQQMDTDLYVVDFGGAAGAVPVLTFIKVDGNTLLTTTASSTQVNGVVNGWDMAVTSTLTCVHVATNAIANAPMFMARFTVTKNGTGVAPSVAMVESLIDGGAANYTGAAYTINVVPDSANKDLCLVVGVDGSTFLRAFAVTGCISGSLTSGTSVILESVAATGYLATALGQTFSRRNVKSVSAGKFHVIWQSGNNYTRVAKVNVSGTTSTVKLSNYVPKAITAIQSVLPLVSGATESEFVVFHGAPNAAFSGIATFTEDATENVNFKYFQAPVGDHLATTVASSVLCTSDGWILVQIAQPNTATAAVVLNSTYALFKALPGGQCKYYGQVSLPINSQVGAVYNPQFIEAGKIVHSHVANDYDYTQNIPYRRATYIEFAKN